MRMILNHQRTVAVSIIGSSGIIITACILLVSLYTCHAAAFVIKSSVVRSSGHSVGVDIVAVAANHHHHHLITTHKTTGWWTRGTRTISSTTANTNRASSRTAVPSQKSLQLNLGPSEAWSAYNDALESSPLLVKSVTASIILGAADLSGQSLEKIRNKQQQQQQEEEADSSSSSSTSSSIDWPRAIRFAIFGLVLQAPWNHYYYMILDNQIPPTVEPFTITNGLKVVIDQFIQAPIFTVCIFIFLGLLEGKTIEAIEKQLNNDYKPTLVANWKLWVPATIVNIGFVPPLFRVLYLNCVFFFWSIYLSLVLNKNEESSPEA